MKQQEVDLIVKYMAEKISPYLIILFGSTLTKNTTLESDIDLAFLSSQKHTAYDVFIVSQELADMLGREVDLVDLWKVINCISGQGYVYRQSYLLSDETKRMLSHMLALKIYARLNEERRVIINRIVKGETI